MFLIIYFSLLFFSDQAWASGAEGKINKIYRYSCTKTFFEGEGVSPDSIACVSGQKLGMINASFDYYLFSSQVENNLAEKTGDIAFDSPICGNNSFLKFSCSESEPLLRYGLYAERFGPFEVKITLATKPDSAPSVPTEGYAALPDAAGNCPLGLEKALVWVAIPKSMLPEFVPGQILPSNFINNGNLNNTVLETAEMARAQMVVTRSSNSKPCSIAQDSTNGDCSAVEFESARIAQRVSYSSSATVVCVIPKGFF